jgi:hypothetical protein
VHVPTLFCTVGTCNICWMKVRRRGCIKIIHSCLTVQEPISVTDHDSSTRRQVLKDDIGRVATIILTDLTRAPDFTIRCFAVMNCKCHKCITPIIVFPHTSSLCNPRSVNLFRYIQYTTSTPTQ